MLQKMNSKKQRCKSTHEEGLDWSALPDLPLDIVASYLNTVDHASFRLVCSSWTECSTKRSHTPFLITISTTSGFSFYDLSRRENIALPSGVNLQSHGGRYAGCAFGWLALVKEEPLLEKATVTLINPFSSASIELSELTGLLLFGGRVILSGSPANLQQPPMVVCHSFYPRQLMFQKMGDEQWKTIQNTASLVEVIACNDRFYGFDSANVLYAVDLHANNGNGAVVPLLLKLPDIFSGGPPPQWRFLAKFFGDLIVMCSHNERELFLKVDLENLRLDLMPNMAGYIVFQSQSFSFSILGDREFLAQLNHDGHHIVNTGSPNHVIIIYAHYWKHPDRKVRWRSIPLGWITPDLNKS